MSETGREYAANYRQAPLHTRFKKGQSGNSRGRPAKNLAALLARGAERDGDRHRERETPAGHQARGGHRSAGQQIGLSRAAGHQDADRHAAGHRKKGGALIDRKSPFGPTDKEVVQQLVTRLRCNMCNGCPWAAQRGSLEASLDVPGNPSRPLGLREWLFLPHRIPFPGTNARPSPQSALSSRLPSHVSRASPPDPVRPRRVARYMTTVIRPR